MRIGRKRAALAAIVVALGCAYLVARPWLGTVAFLLYIAGDDSIVRRVLPSRPSPVTTSDIAVPTRDGAIRARVYRPSTVRAGSPDPVVVFPGVHGGGVDEPRLVTFAGRLAATGLVVVSVPLPELREFRITGRSTDMVEDATRWVAAQPSLAPRGRVSLVGVSFGGGLAVVAAGRPSLEGRLTRVVSLGGYGDLPRVLRYLCTGMAPGGRTRPPHDYGVAVVALAAVPLIVPAGQAAALDAGIRTYLEASLDETPGQMRAARLVAEAGTLAAAMPDPARTIMHAILARDVAAVGRTILPFLDQLGRDPALSPERSPAARVPVFLLHGHDDNVIPPEETQRLAAYLTASGNPHVHWLVSPVLSHVGVDMTVGAGDAWRFVRFWHETLH
jgi:acetyl esterase/lipase